MIIDHNISPPLVRWKTFDAIPGLIAAFSTRLDGVSPAPYESLNLGLATDDNPVRLAENRQIFLGAAGIDPTRLVWAKQEHTTTVLTPDTPGAQGSCDALLTQGNRWALAATFADCLPLLLVEPESQTLCMVHAGWRGTAAGIARYAVEAMQDKYQITPEKILAVIGPHILPCCFEVGTNVAEQFPDDCQPGRDAAHWQVDLAGANTRLLKNAGVLPEHINAQALCTSCESHYFFSHRRDGFPSGRHMAVLAWHNTELDTQL